MIKKIIHPNRPFSMSKLIKLVRMAKCIILPNVLYFNIFFFFFLLLCSRSERLKWKINTWTGHGRKFGPSSFKFSPARFNTTGQKICGGFYI